MLLLGTTNANAVYQLGLADLTSSKCERDLGILVSVHSRYGIAVITVQKYRETCTRHSQYDFSSV